MYVSDDAVCLFHAALCVDGVHRGKFCIDDPLCSLYHLLKSLPFCLGGITVPDSDAGCENVLHQTFEVYPVLGLFFFNSGSGLGRPAEVAAI